MRICLLICSALVLAGCTTSGPQKALDNLADALEENNPQAFLAQIDMQAYAASSMRSLTAGNEIAGVLNSVTQSLGLGNLDNLIGSFVDMRAQITEQFTQGVASGEMMADCRVATSPSCPWVPDSLRGAQIIQISSDAAVARVTTPARITSWLALRKIGEKWLITGKAVLEKTAREYAAQGRPAGQPAKRSIDL